MVGLQQGLLCVVTTAMHEARMEDLPLKGKLANERLPLKSYGEDF